jgi:hypothetical protein
MGSSEDTGMFGMGQGCSAHGDEHMKECTMCGAEFCRACFPRATVCPDCAEQAEEEEEDESKNPDFDDVSNLDEVLEEKDDAEDEEDEGIPPGGVADDESGGRF